MSMLFNTRDWKPNTLENTGNVLYYGGWAGFIATIPLMFVDFGLSAALNLLVQIAAVAIPLLMQLEGTQMLQEASHRKHAMMTAF